MAKSNCVDMLTKCTDKILSRHIWESRLPWLSFTSLLSATLCGSILISVLHLQSLLLSHGFEYHSPARVVAEQIDLEGSVPLNLSDFEQVLQASLSEGRKSRIRGIPFDEWYSRPHRCESILDHQVGVPASKFNVKLCVFEESCFDGYIEITRTNQTACHDKDDILRISQDSEFTRFAVNHIGPDEFYLVMIGPELKDGGYDATFYPDKCSWRIPFELIYAGVYEVFVVHLRERYSHVREFPNDCSQAALNPFGRNLKPLPNDTIGGKACGILNQKTRLRRIHMCPNLNPGALRPGYEGHFPALAELQDAGIAKHMDLSHTPGSEACSMIEMVYGTLVSQTRSDDAFDWRFIPYNGCRFERFSVLPHPSPVSICGFRDGYQEVRSGAGFRITMYGDSQTRALYAGADAWLNRIYGVNMDWQYHFTNSESILVDGLNLTFARLPFPDEYFDLWSPTDQISGREAALLDTDVLIFQFGQWPAGSLMLNKGHWRTRKVYDHLLAMLERVKVHVLTRNTAARNHTITRGLRPIRFVWQGMQPVAVQKLEYGCFEQQSDWRTHTRMLLWHHMATSVIRETNRQIANEIKERGLSVIPGASVKIAMVESFRKMSSLISMYSPDMSHLYGLGAVHLLAEALAKAGLCRI